MSAQSPGAGNNKGDTLRTQSPDFVPFIQNKIPLLNQYSRSFFLYLVACVTIVALITIFFIGTGRLQKVPEKSKESFLAAASLFENVYDGQRYQEFIGKGTQNKDTILAFDNLVKAFSYLSTEYIRAPSPEKRQVLLSLAAHIKIKFPEGAEAVDLTVPCRQESCGAGFSYSDELKEIKSRVESETALTDIEKEAILTNLKNAALAAGKGDKEDEFNSLSIAFQSLKNIWQINRQESIKELAERLLVLMEKNNPDFYKLGVEVGTFKLE